MFVKYGVKLIDGRYLYVLTDKTLEIALKAMGISLSEVRRSIPVEVEKEKKANNFNDLPEVKHSSTRPNKPKIPDQAKSPDTRNLSKKPQNMDMKLETSTRKARRKKLLKG